MIHNARAMHAITDMVYHDFSFTKVEFECMLGRYGAGRGMNDGS